MAWHGKFRPGLLLLLFSFVVISEATAKTLEIRYETAYACEGKILKIECKDGELIKLIRANYGRFSITICNDHGNTDWSVNCMSPKSLRVLHSRCSDKQNCTVEINNETFGDDPCPDTSKYIEAHYDCMSATTTTTTSRPSPPWLITSQPPMWSTIKAPSSRPTHPTPPPKPAVISLPQTPGPSTSRTKSTSTTRYFSVTPPPQLPVQPHNTGEFDEDAKLYPIPDEITTLPFTTVTPIGVESNKPTYDVMYTSVPSILPSWGKDSEGIPYHCSPQTVRSIYWNWTKVNATSIQPCPGGTTGFAKWHCQAFPNSKEPQWYPPNPDLSECRSVWLTSLEQRIIVGRDPLLSITNDLAQVTSSKTLFGGDMMFTTKIIQKLTEKMSKDIQTFPDAAQREQFVTELLSDVALTGSNLLDASQRSSWKDLSYKEQMNVATSLLIELEENAFLLAETVNNKKTVDRHFKNILLSVRVLDVKSLSYEVFPEGATKKHWKVSNDVIELPRGALIENSDGSLVRLVFVAFDRLEEILQWQPEGIDTPNPSNNVSKVLNSKVISASLGKGRHIQLKEPVKLTLQHLKIENVSNPTCVFWDYTTNAWSEEGCYVDYISSNLTHTTCYCDHLTNFAILMDVHAIYLPMAHEIALQVITYVGCIISIICLVLAIITFQLFRGLKSDRTTIHCNLCICLLIAEVIFLFGISQTENRIVCGVIAGFLQYFFLCAFFWMFFEGFQLYVMLIEVFEVEKSRMRWYYCIAYGLPFLIIFISAVIYPQGYGTYRHCWLQTDNYFIFSFVVPVAVIISLNVIFLIMAIVMMCKHSSNTVSMKNKEHSRLASTSGKEENALHIKIKAHFAWLKGAFILVFLLGLTWTFGFLYLNKESVAMAYIFAILNSLQGFFIFLFHCIQNEKVRKEYRKIIRRHSWLPQCLRCSSPSGGSGSTSGSSGMAKERRTSLYGGSNGNPSAGTNSHSTDNSVLTQHGTSLHRDWNSRSCTNVNRVCKTPVPTSTSANMAATLSRPIRTTPTNLIPDIDSNNTSTLPYFRNFYKISSNNPNIPKSISTWGPLHKPLHSKNISFKSCSRDSGHGGSEQEDSPRSHMVLVGNAVDPGPGHLITLNTKDIRHQMLQEQPTDLADFDICLEPNIHPKHLALPQNFHKRKPPGMSHHTYTEIYDSQIPRGLIEDDPVYEEIDRSEIQVSDMSDEDGKRQSDMSRQSSRSYGDHRPLIPYSPANERNFADVMKHYAKDLNHGPPSIGMDTYRRRNMAYRVGMTGDTSVRSLAAVLDGETVVCHLEPPENQYPNDTFVSRTLVLPPYSES
ncbi:latrophilin Cirl isoform X1 [Diabrotica virgifera virgifera]|uniref:Latrophilin Cirl n=1 Tax=Diabrotica virgifera virgifera TaxID=50390 RepID=A0ABM5LAP8_DIAVI|nr:latrophilin Cirl isoform X1 [Diabrotica virgifera virgifera]XP_050519508.1 latrophilin Cirl isoform X1 [Diabrotica virgifera virgifera]XP_050519509.1 latrophilin Cirl isoform X1 [Diabrotica virgifera virgifera]